MKFQDSSFNGLKVTVGTESVTHAHTHGRSICPINFFKVGGIKQTNKNTCQRIFDFAVKMVKWTSKLESRQCNEKASNLRPKSGDLAGLPWRYQGLGLSWAISVISKHRHELIIYSCFLHSSLTLLDHRLLAAPGVVTSRDGGCRRRSLGDASLHDPVYARVSPWTGSSPTIQECMCSECRWGAYQFIIFIKK